MHTAWNKTAVSFKLFQPRKNTKVEKIVNLLFYNWLKKLDVVQSISQKFIHFIRTTVSVLPIEELKILQAIAAKLACILNTTEMLFYTLLIKTCSLIYDLHFPRIFSSVKKKRISSSVIDWISPIYAWHPISEIQPLFNKIIVWFYFTTMYVG